MRPGIRKGDTTFKPLRPPPWDHHHPYMSWCHQPQQAKDEPITYVPCIYLSSELHTVLLEDLHTTNTRTYHVVGAQEIISNFIGQIPMVDDRYPPATPGRLGSLPIMQPARLRSVLVRSSLASSKAIRDAATAKWVNRACRRASLASMYFLGSKESGTIPAICTIGQMGNPPTRQASKRWL